MNYIIITDYYHPIVKSGSIIVGDLANELINNGHNVTLITFVNHDSQEDKISFDGEIKIIRITTIFRKFGRFGRLLAEQSYSNKIIRNLRVYHDIKCDAIICYSPSIFYGKALKWLKNKYNSKAYLIVRDIFPKWALDSGLIKRGLIYNYFKYVEKKLYNAADIIGIETKSDIFYFENYGLPKTIQIEVLSNWGSALDELIDEPDEKILDNKKINIVYGGNIGDAQDLFSLVDSIDYSILDKRAQLTLIGGGNQYNKIKNLIYTKKLRNIILMPLVERSIYWSILLKADIGLVSLGKNMKSHNLPLKMMGYMQLSKPILASVNTNNEIIQLIVENNIGLVSEASDVKNFNINLNSIISNEQARRLQGENSFKLFNNRFTVKHAAKQIYTHFI